jgi:hypothetical protein
MTWHSLTMKKTLDPPFCDIADCGEKTVSAIVTRDHLPRNVVRLCERHSRHFHENDAWRSVSLREVDVIEVMTA